MRRVFEDKSIDAVTVATTNHWHALTAIWAMQAGKDAFVEKPVSHNIYEGHQAGRDRAEVQANGRRMHAAALLGPLPEGD
jgi:predicted dehydrogenase